MTERNLLASKEQHFFWENAKIHCCLIVLAGGVGVTNPRIKSEWLFRKNVTNWKDDPPSREVGEQLCSQTAKKAHLKSVVGGQHHAMQYFW